MRYVRTFHIQAAHFSTRQAYDIVWQVFDRSELPENLYKVAKGMTLQAGLAKAFTQIHGHNFRIAVCIDGTPDAQGFVIDDQRLADLVNQWNGINLSMHYDFLVPRQRATTEQMALTLKSKINTLVALGSEVVSVRVNETDDIFAEV